MQLIVRKDLSLTWPRAETPSEYIAMGTDKDLTVATKTAVQQMVDFLVLERHLTRLAAYQLASIAGNVGVHVVMPKSIFR